MGAGARGVVAAAVVALAIAEPVVLFPVHASLARHVADWALDECSDAAAATAEDVAATVADQLPGRTDPVRVSGTCGDAPYRIVTTTTSVERRSLSADLRQRWRCRWAAGALPPMLDCADLGGHVAWITIDEAGRVLVEPYGS